MQDTVQPPLHTIAALATAPQPAGVAIVRISGKQSAEALKALFHSKQDPTTTPRTLCYGKVLDYHTKQPIDHALCVYMPGPNSFTGEDVVEFHLHGSPLIAKRVLQSLFAFGITPAEAGEFTKRAFLNGKLDLVQAEAVGELITATSEAALRVASDNLSGKLSTFIDGVAEPLRDLFAEIQAALDFPEEEIPPVQISHFMQILANASASLHQLLLSFQSGKLMREGYKVLLCGPPNAGKSSLLNTLLGRERAIVSDISGTTRDLIEEECIIGKHRFVLCDSAGLTKTDNEIEKLGIELSLERMEWADLVLLVIDASATYSDLDTIIETIGEKSPKTWMVTNKVDLNTEAIGKYYCDSSICHRNFYLSVKNKNGIEDLKSALVQEVENLRGDTSHASFVLTQARQAHLVEQAIAHAAQAQEMLSSSGALEIVSEEVRLALTQLEEIVGRTYTEDILGRIFSKFCIGK
jgi:tRNA modification GTPase